MPFVIVVVVFIAALFFTTVKVLNEYERGVMFTLGRFTGIKGPGLILLWPDSAADAQGRSARDRAGRA